MKPRYLVLAAALAAVVSLQLFGFSLVTSGSLLADSAAKQADTQPAATPAAKPAVVEVTSANYKDEVENSTVPVIIDFSATWCGPCRRFAPEFKAAAKHYAGKVKFVHIDVDDSPDLARQYGANRIPTIVFLKNPKAGPRGAVTTTGYRDSEAVKKFVEENRM